MTLRIKGIDHVVIRTGNLKTMLEFYSDVLGCALERRSEESGLYQLRAGDALIDLVDVAGKLGKQGGPPPGSDGHNMDHYCLLVEEWDEVAIRATFEQHGVEAGETKWRNGAVGKSPSIFIRDTDGNRVELKGPVE